MVTNKNTMFAFCIDADQTGLPAVKGIMWYATAKISARGTQPLSTRSAIQTICVASAISPMKINSILIILATKASTKNQLVGEMSSCSRSPKVMKMLMSNARWSIADSKSMDMFCSVSRTLDSFSIVINENTAGKSSTAIVEAVNRAATIDALASLASRPLEERETATNAAPTRR